MVAKWQAKRAEAAAEEEEEAEASRPQSLEELEMAKRRRLNEWKESLSTCVTPSVPPGHRVHTSHLHGSCTDAAHPPPHLRASRAAPPPICACAIHRESTQANSNFTPLAGGRDWRARVKKASQAK